MKQDKTIDKIVYVVTRSEEQSDYVEAVFCRRENAEKYCKQFNDNEDEYHRDITETIIKDLMNYEQKHDAYWLEKQGEQKSVDAVEPKFNMADWIVMSNGKAYQVISVNEYFDEYILADCNGSVIKRSIQETDKSASVFTIKDAKDGDVLCLGDVIAIFKKHIGKEECICYCSFCDVGDFEIPIENGEDNVYGCTNTTPATQEECNLLFQKMREAGYKWNADEKVVNKVIIYE